MQPSYSLVAAGIGMVVNFDAATNLDDHVHRIGSECSILAQASTLTNKACSIIPSCRRLGRSRHVCCCLGKFLAKGCMQLHLHAHAHAHKETRPVQMYDPRQLLHRDLCLSGHTTCNRENKFA